MEGITRKRVKDERIQRSQERKATELTKTSEPQPEVPAKGTFSLKVTLIKLPQGC